jgi:hypothetical protein
MLLITVNPNLRRREEKKPNLPVNGEETEREREKMLEKVGKCC